MKDALLKGELNKIGEILSFGWQNKKNMAHSISNQHIDSIYTTAIGEGATGGKISGAGGGGFMFFFCPGITKMKVAKAIEKLGGRVQPFKFTQQGLVTWTIN
jgi:D-glycero-alpha-D-manno-heptose-7-phosphate kinase